MILPHGGKLISRFFSHPQKSNVKIQLNHSKEINVYNIATGAYSPLEGFCGEEDFMSIIKTMRLANGRLWSIPIIFDITKEQSEKIQNSKTVELINSKGIHVASFIEPQIYKFDKKAYCESVFGFNDNNHPGVQKIEKMGEYLIGGKIEVLKGWKILFDDIDNENILSPCESRTLFQKKGFEKIVAFQTRNVPHRGHEYIQKCALENTDALLIHPVIGEKKSGDFQNDAILGSYKILAQKYYNPDRVIISCLPWSMLYAGPKEAILHAIVRQNFGCSHFIVGRDHAGVGNYYGTYDAQKIFNTISPQDLEITILCYENAAYCPQVKGVVTDKTSPSINAEKIFISGTNFRNMLIEGVRPPEEFIRPEIVDYLLSKKNIFVD